MYLFIYIHIIYITIWSFLSNCLSSPHAIGALKSGAFWMIPEAPYAMSRHGSSWANHLFQDPQGVVAKIEPQERENDFQWFCLCDPYITLQYM